MGTLLVLTDFSKAAEYAASYACILAEQLKSKTIVLYHSYQVVIPLSEAVVVPVDLDVLRKTSIGRIKDLEMQINNKIPAGVTIRYRTDAEGLNNINTIAKEEGARLIIMGTVNKTKFEQIILGSTAITVCKASDYPVILVPLQAKIQRVAHIVFACDMKEVEKTIPLANLKMIMDDFKVPLSILNVDYEDKHFAPDTPLNAITLHDMLKDYNPAYYNISDKDVVNGITEFAKQHPATLVLLISKKHNFMEGLFHRSLTKKLAFTTPFPLLVLREKDQKE